jgi:hypothetical protein
MFLMHAARCSGEREGGRKVAAVGWEPEGGVGKGLPGQEQAVDRAASLLILRCSCINCVLVIDH